MIAQVVVKYIEVQTFKPAIKENIVDSDFGKLSQVCVAYAMSGILKGILQVGTHFIVGIRTWSIIHITANNNGEW